MKAKDLDKIFDDGNNITKYLNYSKARRPEQEQKRVNVDFPVWTIPPGPLSVLMSSTSSMSSHTSALRTEKT